MDTPADFTKFVQDLQEHPRSAYSSQPKGPLTYVLVHRHPSWLLPVANDKRTREGTDYQQHFASFFTDVKTRGVQQPVIAVVEGEVARVIDGETRRQAALLAGLDSVPILVYQSELTDNDLIIAQLQANAQRRDFTELELAAIYAELMKLNNWSQADLARNIHVSPGRVSKILAISMNLCAEVQAMIPLGLPPRAAYALSRVEPQHQIELANKCLKEILCVVGVEAQVAKLLGRREKSQKPIKIVYAGVTAVVKGNVVESLALFAAKIQEAIKRLQKDNLPPEFLAGLLK